MTPDNQTKVPFKYEHKNRETPKARLFGFDKCQVWIPKSQIMDEKESTIVMPEWLAKEKGLI